MPESRPGLRLFESLVYAGNLEAAMQALPETIHEARVDSGSGELTDRRFAIALIELLGSPHLQIGREQFAWICLYLPEIRAVFAAAGLDSTEFMARSFMRLYDSGWMAFPDEKSLMQGLLFWDPMAPRLDLVATAQNHPEIISAFLLSVLNFTSLVTRENSARFERLLQEYWTTIENLEPDPFLLRCINNPWMYCSYASAGDKHRIKQTLNALLKNYAEQASDSGVCKWKFSPGSESGRKRVLIPLDQFKSSHAMYRCFNRVIRQLGERYHTVALVNARNIDEVARACFTEVVELDEDELIDSPRTHLECLQSARFDAVYFPSLGMSLAGLLLANQRIAPLQCMTLGHPASSFIDCMDYVLVQEQDFGTAEVFTETVLLTGNETSSTMPATGNVASPARAAAGEPLHIAVVSSWLKVNYRFIRLCLELVQRAARPLVFHLFTGAQGIIRRELAHALSRYSLEVKIEQAAEFDTYLQQLAGCELRLGTFPFGGANSNMDCFALGIPSVVMAGNQPHSQSDVGQMQRAGLEAELVAHDEQDYLDKALRLIEDDSYRVAMSERIVALRDDPFFSGAVSESGKFLHSFSWMMDHHEQLQRSDRKVWPFEDQRDDIGRS